MIVRCVYASRAAKPLDARLIDDILEKSRRNNPAQGITGVLCYSGDTFIQVLEGGRDEVCDLFNNIVRDARHDNVRLLAYEEIRERKFCNWTMGHVDLAKINPSVLLKYYDKPVLNPFANPGHATVALLDELVANAAISCRLT